MQKTLLLTGSTDGIGLETAKRLVSEGQRVLVHGRNRAKLDAVVQELSALPGAGAAEGFAADLSKLDEVDALASAVLERHPRLDVLINNAGVFATREARTPEGLDVRFVVNAIAPYLLAQRLLPALGSTGRIVNLSSAAQAPVDTQALAHGGALSDGAAYAQSKLALTMWSRSLALAHPDGPVVVAVNPGSMLGTKMVKQAYGVAGADLSIGVDILVRAALGEDFASASGQYFDNDARRFAAPHPDALDASRCAAVVGAIESVLARRRAS